MINIFKHIILKGWHYENGDTKYSNRIKGKELSSLRILELKIILETTLDHVFHVAVEKSAVLKPISLAHRAS